MSYLRSCRGTGQRVLARPASLSRGTALAAPLARPSVALPPPVASPKATLGLVAEAAAPRQTDRWWDRRPPQFFGGRRAPPHGWRRTVPPRNSNVPLTERLATRCLAAFRRSILCFVVLPTAYCLLPTVFAAQWPSVFRGVVVADSPLGVQVVSVEESSQAYLADLRPEDLIIQIQGEAVHSIDEFAMRSNTLKAERAIEVTVLVFRNGNPRELHLHLYSYPILGEWGISFIPDFDLRFGEPRTGLDYWRRLGRGFEEAGKPHDALNAYLNGLHNVPTDLATAVKVTELFSRASQRQLQQGQLAEGLATLRQATLMMEKLFDDALTDAQLHTLKRQLEDTLRVLRHMPGRPPRATSRLEGLGII